ncbi:MAG TPA: hypothetical protein PKD66_11980 [Azonexus sp.]|nr:hypothetical protein [Azonexus sp.]
MALPWKLILTNVPWSDVLGKAPIIADSAKKLWKGMSRKNGDGSGSDSLAEPYVAPDADLATRLAALETVQRKLRTQMLASGELIQALSEQNALLVAQIDKFRRLTQRLAWCLAATAVVAGLALFIAWQPRITEFFA